MAVQSTLINLPGGRDQIKLNVEGAVTRKAYIDASSTNLTSGDYYRLFEYGANTIIQNVHIITETVEGAADTVDVTDDESGTTTLCSNHDLNTDNAITNYRTGIFKNSARVCIDKTRRGAHRLQVLGGGNAYPTLHYRLRGMGGISPPITLI